MIGWTGFPIYSNFGLHLTRLKSDNDSCFDVTRIPSRKTFTMFCGNSNIATRSLVASSGFKRKIALSVGMGGLGREGNGV